MKIIDIIDLGNQAIQVMLRVGSDIPRRSPSPIPFENPFGTDEKKELRWYLEDYLQSPYEDWRAKQVEKRIAEWGEALFSRVFVRNMPNPDPYTLYQEAVREGLDSCQLSISSDDPNFLNIPWEVIRDPTPGRGYLAPLLGGLFRHRTGHKMEYSYELKSRKPFRILLVISRPYGERDVPFRSIARPMLEVLHQLWPRIQIEILRPPTFDALVNRLNSKRGYYDLVHFDGHGVFHKSSRQPSLRYSLVADSGHLAFEKNDGTEHIVSSQELGQALASCRVPLFVINACQSAQEGTTDPFSSIASQLVAIGAKGVLTMSYSVYAEAAVKFMQRFYEKIMEFTSVSEAVAAGRRRLYSEPWRDSIFGLITLQDWMVPTLYQQDYSFFPMGKVKETVATTEPQPSFLLESLRELCPQGRFGFIGRDYELLQIERAFYGNDRPWVLLTGMGGIGKTELVFGFARWFVETAGCAAIFPISFKQKADFGQILRSVFQGNPAFLRLSDKQQWNELIRYLRKNSCLLLWDNFETVTGYPQGSSPLATDKARGKMARLLSLLRGGKSRVLIATRKPDEKWLKINYNVIELSGLSTNDAGLMAKQVLDTAGCKMEDFRSDPNYLRLIRLLKGHPRSLEIVLPQLKKRRPSEIIEALHHRVDALGEALEDATLEYAFSQMSERTRKHLPFVGLFSSQIAEITLSIFLSPESAHSKAYETIMGELLSNKEWAAVLEEGNKNGILQQLGNRIYGLHPTLPSFLRQQLVATVGEKGFEDLNLEFMKFYGYLASSLRDEVGQGDPRAVGIASIEEDNLLRALWIAMRQEEWENVLIISQILDGLYSLSERLLEGRALRLSVLSSIGENISTQDSLEHGRLWRYLLGTEAMHATERREFRFAEKATKKILRYLLSLKDQSFKSDIKVESDIAVAYHQLGTINLDQGEINEAEGWYKKALAVNKRIRLRHHIAANYHQLGMCAQRRYAFDKAISWFNKALKIAKHLGNQRHEADTSHHLGVIAREQGRLDDAEQWLLRAQAIRETLGLGRNAAKGYNELSVIARKNGQLEKAVRLARKALNIFETVGLEQGKADSFIILGSIAREGGRLDDAEQWFNKALTINERLGLKENTAQTYNELGITAFYRGAFEDALKWYLKATQILEDLQTRFLTAHVQANLGTLFHKQGQKKKAIRHMGKALRIAQTFKLPLEQDILNMLASLMNSLGEEEFKRIWKQLSGDSSALVDIQKFMEKKTLISKGKNSP